MPFSSFLSFLNPRNPKSSVPFVGMPQKAIEDTLSFVQLTDHDILYDLGCGEGDILIQAATTRRTRCVGLDIDANVAAKAKRRALHAGVHFRVRVAEGDFEQIEDLDRIHIEDATVVTLFLLPETLARLLPVLRERMKSGARIVSIACKPLSNIWPADKIGYTAGFEIPGKPIPMYHWKV